MPEDLVFLYVEDDLASRMVVQMLMPILGYPKLTILEDSTDFIACIEQLQDKPDVFLLDIQVKPIDGFGMLKLLRTHPNFQDTIVIALTASVMNEEIKLLRMAGFNSVISKPIDQRRFPELLNQILNGEEVWTVT
jgi:two-component system, cell cycle response regulator DivK